MELKELKNNWILHQLIIMTTSFILGILLSLKLTYSHESLFWTASTVIQAFGALIAIVLAIGISQIKSLMQLKKQQIGGLNLYFSTIPKKDNKEAIKVGLKQYEQIKNDNENLVYEVFKKLGNTLLPILTLIGWAIIILIFAEPIQHLSVNKPGSANAIISVALVYLGLSSFYCLQKLVNRIRDVLIQISI